MTSDNNPYMPPAEDASAAPSQRSGVANNEASNGQRLLTLVIDYVVMTALFFVFAMFEVRQPGAKNTEEDLFSQLISLGILIAYYILCEATTGRTIGKLVAGTKVETVSGGVPTFVQIVGRTFARLVPFEPFSFLTSRSGWHDRWSGTRVVRTRDVAR